jgi:hypothetical protein
MTDLPIVFLPAIQLSMSYRGKKDRAKKEPERETDGDQASICPSKRPFRSCWPMTDQTGQPSTTSDVVPHKAGKGGGGGGRRE